MNTKNLKAYAPKARKQFIDAVKKRAAHFGIYKDRIEEVRIEGGAAIIEGRAFTRKEGEQRKRLENKVTERGYEMFIREMAYTWFNRLAALRYMEIHDYFDHGFRVLSHPANPDSLPEILSHASDVADSLGLDKSYVIDLQLAGDKEEELYRELLLGQCHHLSKIMPFMFEAIDDATELLLPNNLTKTDSILKGLISDIPEEDWKEIEVIGWLYQFYISEHKDAVMGKVVKSEDIPAATQLFTPNWIVKYLVQNSVGRQWLATYPDSELKGKMEYYIEPAEQSDEVIEQLKAITPTSIDPEEIKVLDPACGSGHILVEVYEVLREIYLERGYRLREIPELILTNNIYGLDIDDRAAQLAGFALMMKAREDDRRIFHRVEDGDVSLNVFSMQSTEHLDIPKLWKALDLEGNQQTGSTGGLFDTSEESDQPKGIYKQYFELLLSLKDVFLQSKTLGSLIQVEDQLLDNLLGLKEKLKKKKEGTDPAAKQAAFQCLTVINQAIVLCQKYDVSIANPPYMGSNGMTSILKKFGKENYKLSKFDLFSMFMERSFYLLKKGGFNAQVNMQSWMFLTSFEEFRKSLVENYTFDNLMQIGYNSFPELNSKVVQCSAFSIRNCQLIDYAAKFINLNSAPQSADKKSVFLNRNQEMVYCLKQSEFSIIPGTPIAYWVNSKIRNIFKTHDSLSDVSKVAVGLQTGDNDRFLRYWHEISKEDLSLGQLDVPNSGTIKWFPYNKGGDYRKWYGNQEYVINWKYDGQEIKNFKDDKGKLRSVIRNPNFYFKECATWSALSSGGISLRYTPTGFLFDTKGQCIFPQPSTNTKQLRHVMGVLNSSFASTILQFLAPTLDFNAGAVAKMPIKIDSDDDRIANNVCELIEIFKSDWDSRETSWNFKSSPIKRSKGLLKKEVLKYLDDERKITESALQKEKLNDSLVAELFDIELTTMSEASPLSIYSQLCLHDEKLALANSINQLLSFSVGCMMGRFSLDYDGIVYANTCNEGFKELEAKGAFNTYSADDDGIIPLASEEWLFDDDATARFKEFVTTAWGDEHLAENLEFVAESLCLHALKPKKGENAMETIRRYFSTQFFKDHCKTYKKRPIYWLFSSGKEKAFECLVYLHRYNEGTLSRMRTEYVTPLMGKYDAQHTLLSEQQLQAIGTEGRRIEKEVKSLEKKQAELRTFDEQLKHYAEMRITLDLDDGVKANYGKFGNLLADVKAIHGKEVK